jgi:hypothetical protein
MNPFAHLSRRVRAVFGMLEALEVHKENAYVCVNVSGALLFILTTCITHMPTDLPSYKY